MTTPRHPHFTRTLRPKSGGEGFREIWEPDAEALKANRRIAHAVNYALAFSVDPGDRARHYRHSQGGGFGNSPARNVARHADNWHFFMTDLRDAYGSVDGDLLVERMVEIGAFTDTELAQEQLAEFCLHPDGRGIMQGAPAAPALFNAYCLPLDIQLGELSDRYGLAYTRYLDDLTFSAPQADGPIGKHKRKALFEVIANDGWTIASRKTRVESLPRPVTITGLSLYRSGHWRASPGQLEGAHKAFSALEDLLDQGGNPTLHDIGVIDGHHGTICGGYDPRRGQPTPIEKQLIARYRALRARCAPLLGSGAVANG